MPLFVRISSKIVRVFFLLKIADFVIFERFPKARMGRVAKLLGGASKLMNFLHLARKAPGRRPGLAKFLEVAQDALGDGLERLEDARPHGRGIRSMSAPPKE